MARQLRREDYTVGWVCALPVELAAAQEMLDEEHKTPPTDDHDTNIYTCGRIGEHNVVIACLPHGQTGTSSAAAVAVQMKSTFRSTRFGLMVGIGGGVPSDEDVRLGDVVIGTPAKTHGGVVQYDFGKSTPSGFERTGSLNTAPTILLNAVGILKARKMRGKSDLSTYLSKLEILPGFKREAAGDDILFEAEYDHEGGATCAKCNKDRLVARKPDPRDPGSGIVVHYGTIASGNQVMRYGTERDRVSKELGGVLCFEMEAAGLMNSYPCLVIRGICDYSDSHKNKRWQTYAAAAAAACAKEVLAVIPSTDVVQSITVEEAVRNSSSTVIPTRQEQGQYLNVTRLPASTSSARLHLLSLDGGGVRGLSTLYILKGLMRQVNRQRKDKGLPFVKPCEVFHLIGGTGTGGIIAIMLGRLEMDVDECIAAYCKMMKYVFDEEEGTGWSLTAWFGTVKTKKFDSNKLKTALEEIIDKSGQSTATMFNDGGDGDCRTFVCSTSKETSGIARLRSYSLPDEGNIDATICQAALATSAATRFFDSVSIGARVFVDGELGANNPVEEVEGEAMNIWGSDEMSDVKSLGKCFVSIGTGNPGKKALEDNITDFLTKSLVDIVRETEKTERNFLGRWTKQYKAKGYFRFNVDQGLQDIGLAEFKEQGKIEAATEEYLSYPVQKIRLQECAESLQQKQNPRDISTLAEAATAPTYAFTAEDEECIKHLRQTNPEFDKRRIEDTKGGLLEGLYSWVLRNSDFQKWRNNQRTVCCGSRVIQERVKQCCSVVSLTT